MIIADVTKAHIREAGIEAGLGNAPASTSGTLSAGIDMKLNAASINKLINSFNGFGSVNLGRVTPDFYMNLKFLEESGDIELRSTPKLSTLNGHEATLKSGETRYYKEVASNIIGTQNPIPERFLYLEKYRCEFKFADRALCGAGQSYYTGNRDRAK